MSFHRMQASLGGISANHAPFLPDTSTDATVGSLPMVITLSDLQVNNSVGPRAGTNGIAASFGNNFNTESGTLTAAITPQWRESSAVNHTLFRLAVTRVRSEGLK